jgi:hypothetical protein
VHSCAEVSNEKYFSSKRTNKTKQLTKRKKIKTGTAKNGKGRRERIKQTLKTKKTSQKQKGSKTLRQLIIFKPFAPLSIILLNWLD